MRVAVVTIVVVLVGALASPAFAAPARPFGSHPQPLAPGTLQPRADAAERDRATAAAYDAWAAR